ncbi:aspartate 4-decarboxylase [Vagococcus sp. JNUCC 83]
MIEQLSSFELNLLLEKNTLKEKYVLNAGRGNPNWHAPVPREAFLLLSQFALMETMDMKNSLIRGGIKSDNTRYKRFQLFLEQKSGEGALFLHNVLTNGTNFFGIHQYEWLDKMLDYSLGDNYPNPVRCLEACESPIKHYLDKELFSSKSESFDIFPVEGGTAGICYLFDTLINNFILNKGDKIALLVPSFAPYLEIPEMPQYEFDVVKVCAKQSIVEDELVYQYPMEEIDKLKDNHIKAVFVVNPSNPTANAMNDSTIQQIKKIILNDNPNLMILTDDVYGTFVADFHSLFSEMPYNCACIYSYSKYFGATGWRVGTVAVARDNIFDTLINQLSLEKKQELSVRYQSINQTNETIRFIDRMVADSRDIALNHAAGLSSIQQVMMTLFSLYALLDTQETYKKSVIKLCHEREKRLFHSLGIKESVESLNTAYYFEFNYKNWLEKRFGKEFSKYLSSNWTMTKILTKLAETEKLLLLKTDDFGSDEWSIRISLANLETEEYEEVGKRIIRLSEALKLEWEKNIK